MLFWPLWPHVLLEPLFLSGAAKNKVDVPDVAGVARAAPRVKNAGTIRM